MARRELERGREAFAREAWADVHRLLSAADEHDALEASDLESLATAGYMLGRDHEFLSGMERAHRARLDAREPAHAARAAFWVGLVSLLHGETARATGWFARAERVLDAAGVDCAERGYLLLPEVLAAVVAGDAKTAERAAARAVEIGERFGDRDLVALSVQEQGHALVRQGRTAQGLRLVDEAMVAVTAGELSPVATGLVYCNTIAFCRDVYELRRAREWTKALAEWCARRPEMVAHTGICLVHRAEVMDLQGDWDGALDEARRAHDRLAAATGGGLDAGEALYRQADLHRRRGEHDSAESAYLAAARCGREPQPGLALLRLAEGRPGAAVAAVRRALEETSAPLERAGILPAAVEILLAAGELAAASDAAAELARIAAAHEGEVLAAMAAGAEGAVTLARGDARAALPSLRAAAAGWQELDAPYEVARIRALQAAACRALGDDDGADLALAAARQIFEQLGAASDVAQLDAVAPRNGSARTLGLTARELEVLRLVAAGRTNREIAGDLVISEHTVARHVQNIFAKLGVSSRTAASALAYQHALV